MLRHFFSFLMGNETHVVSYEHSIVFFHLIVISTCVQQNSKGNKTTTKTCDFVITCLAEQQKCIKHIKVQTSLFIKQYLNIINVIA